MISKRSVSFFLVALLVLAALPQDAAAQEAEGLFTVSPNGGWVSYDDASALSDQTSLGFDLVYHINSLFGIGAWLDIGRPESKGEFFAPARQVYQDTTFLSFASQQVTQTDYGILGKATFPFGRVSASAMGGVGRYTIFLDPEVNRANADFSGMSFMAGGSLGIGLTERTGLQLSVRDLIFTDYDRENLNAVLPQHRDETFPELLEGIPEAKETLHNLRFSLGFIFTPGAQR